MDYEHTICQILAEAGSRGLPVRKVALHVFNASNSLFGETTYEDIYAIVSRYLHRSARSKDSYIKHATRRGYYCLNDNMESVRQQFLNFTDYNEHENPQDCDEYSKGTDENYPSLFFDEE